MIGSTWNVLFVALAVGTGMFAQQAAHKVSAASEDRQVNSLVGLELFCSAEGYYLAGRFNGSPSAAESSFDSPASPPGDEQPLVAANDTPPDDPMQPSEPALATAAAEPPAEPAPETPVEASVAADANDASMEPAVPAPPMPDTTLPDALAGAESQPPAAEAPEVGEPKPAREALAAEVLPPPAPDAEPRAGGDSFGKFADAPSSVVPPRSSVRPPLPTGMAARAGQTYLDPTAGQSSRYASPSDLVRDRAVARGEQRRQRIETRKWLGISPLRPAVDSTPYTAVEPPAQLLLVVPDASSMTR